MRSMYIRKELRVEPLLLCVERNQKRWFSHLIRMPLRCLPEEEFWACPSGRRPQGRPTRWSDYISWLTLGTAWCTLGRVSESGRGMSELIYIDCCLSALGPGNQMKKTTMTAKNFMEKSCSLARIVYWSFIQMTMNDGQILLTNNILICGFQECHNLLYLFSFFVKPFIHLLTLMLYNITTQMVFSLELKDILKDMKYCP